MLLLNHKTTISDTCQLQCVDNGKTMIADVLDFRQQKKLSVSIMKSIKLEMRYNDRTHIYEGNMGGLTFTTVGPIITSIRQGR